MGEEVDVTLDICVFLEGEPAKTIESVVGDESPLRVEKELDDGGYELMSNNVQLNRESLMAYCKPDPRADFSEQVHLRAQEALGFRPRSVVYFFDFASDLPDRAEVLKGLIGHLHKKKKAYYVTASSNLAANAGQLIRGYNPTTGAEIKNTDAAKIWFSKEAFDKLLE